jgi:RNA polymerase sigma-70 factor (ECF subfamily)
MHTTPHSLLQQLRQPATGEAGSRAWERFVNLYTPLFFHWVRRIGLPDREAADFVQDVFTVLVEKLPAFDYDAGKSFRGWLWTVTLNKWRDRRRRHAGEQQTSERQLEDLAGPEEPNALEEAEYRAHVVGRALCIMQAEFAPATWKACWEHVIRGRPAVDVAAELGISVGSVYVAKSRVLQRLREELSGLLD